MCNILIFSQSTSCKANITPFTTLNIFQISILAANFGNYKTQQYVHKSHHQSILFPQKKSQSCTDPRVPINRAAIHRHFSPFITKTLFPFHNKDNATHHVEGNLQMSVGWSLKSPNVHNYKPVILTIKQIMMYFIWEIIIKTETALYIQTTLPAEGCYFNQSLNILNSFYSAVCSTEPKTEPPIVT